jgi:lysyl-tRNA synthetase class II
MKALSICDARRLPDGARVTVQGGVFGIKFYLSLILARLWSDTGCIRLAVQMGKSEEAFGNFGVWAYGGVDSDDIVEVTGELVTLKTGEKAIDVDSFIIVDRGGR